MIFYVAQKPRGVFANETHGHVSMLDAWKVDHEIVSGGMGWRMIRADMTDGRLVDGRHFDAKGIKTVYTGLAPMLLFR